MTTKAAETASSLLAARVKPSTLEAVRQLADDNASTISKTAARLIERQLAASNGDQMERR